LACKILSFFNCDGNIFNSVIFVVLFRLKPDHRDLINILVGAYVGVLAKSTDYWFKDKDDAEDKETQQLHAANGGNNKVEGEVING